MVVIYPLNMIVLERSSWVWDYPTRHPAFEHMLVAIYVSMGAFLIWAARDPLRFLPFIDFVIVSGAIHATVMAVDAWQMPGMSSHLAFRGDVMGTYVRAGYAGADPSALVLSVQAENGMSEARGQLVVRIAARAVIAALLLAMAAQVLALSREDRANVWLTGSLCARPVAATR